MKMFDTPTKVNARTAGLLYLIVVLTGIFSLAYVPAQIFVHGNAAQTVNNIIAQETLFRMGIVASIVCYLAFLLLPFALYRLLSPYGKNAAVLMLVFVVVSVPISLVTTLHKIDILSLLNPVNHMHAFTTEQLQALVMIALNDYRNGLLVSQVFWGLWLFPFGYLVFKSGILPRILGILLMLGCFGYLIDFLGHILFLGYAKTVIASYVTTPADLGEIGICLWLLIMGAREPAPNVGQ